MADTPGPLRYQEVEVLPGHTGGVLAVSFSGNGTYIATSGCDRRVCVWRVDGGALLHSIELNNPVLCLAWLSRQDVLLCGSQDGSISVLNLGEVSFYMLAVSTILTML